MTTLYVGNDNDIVLDDFIKNSDGSPIFDAEPVASIGFRTEHAITDVTGEGVSPIVVTSPNHGLEDGDKIVIRGVCGNLATNTTHTVRNPSQNTFELEGTTGDGDYEEGGSWFLVVPDAAEIPLELVPDAGPKYLGVYEGVSSVCKAEDTEVIIFVYDTGYYANKYWFETPAFYRNRR